jgi:hypothetical protein
VVVVVVVVVIVVVVMMMIKMMKVVVVVVVVVEEEAQDTHCSVPGLGPILKIENRGSVYHQIYLSKKHLPFGKW